MSEPRVPDNLDTTVSYPEAAGWGVVTGRFVYGSPDGPDAKEFPDAAPIQGTMEVTASREIVTFRGDPPTTFYMKPVVCKLSGNGFSSPAGKPYLVLIPTDRGGIAESGWNYTFTFRNKSGDLIHEVTTPVPQGEIVDLTLVLDTEPGAGAGVDPLTAMTSSLVLSVYEATRAAKAAESHTRQAAESAATAETKATEAAGSAKTAEMKVTAAAISAETAESKATAAAVSAATAEVKATEAAGSAAAAQNSAATAEAKAMEAATSAAAAQNSATTAETKATEAAASTATAQGSASVSEAKATEAAASAQTAETKATEAAASAAAAQNSAATAETKATEAEGYVQQVNDALAAGMFDFEINHDLGQIRLKAKGATEWSEWVALPKGDTGRGIKAATVSPEGHLLITYDDQPDNPIDCGVVRVEYTMRVDQTDGNLYYKDNLGGTEKSAGLARGIDGKVGPAPTLTMDGVTAGTGWAATLTPTGEGAYKLGFTAPTPEGVSEEMVRRMVHEQLADVELLAMAGL